MPAERTKAMQCCPTPTNSLMLFTFGVPKHHPRTIFLPRISSLRASYASIGNRRCASTLCPRLNYLPRSAQSRKTEWLAQVTSVEIRVIPSFFSPTRAN
jgi:hypothetical protein